MTKTNSNNSIKKNYIFNMLNQVYALIIPLITMPYVSRILLPDGIGKYSYTASISNYFVMFASLGITMYIQREIANYQGDKKKQSIIFWETNIIKFFTTIISLIVFIVLCLSGIFDLHTNLMWCWTILIFAQAFDITGLFQGNEKFDIIVVRNIIVKTLCIFLIFTIVKDSNDLWLYIVLNSLATLISNITLWISVPKNLNKVKLKELHPFKHIVPVFKLFIPTIAVSLYTVLDKTLIGLLVDGTYIETTTQIVDGTEQIINTTKKYAYLENGYYEQSEKIVKLTLTLITALATVMISRNANEIASGNKEKVRQNLYFSGRFVLILGIPMTLGLIAIAPNLVPWFLGPNFEKSILLMQLFSPLILIIGMCNVFGLQYLIPSKNDNQYAIAVIIGAISNIILNLILIPKFWSIGAVVASLIAELLVCFTMYIYTKREVSIIKIILDSLKCIFAGIVMFIIVYITQKFMQPSIINTVLLISEGCLVYFSILLFLHEELLLKIFKRKM